jgi:hypothetical protein
VFRILSNCLSLRLGPVGGVGTAWLQFGGPVVDPGAQCGCLPGLTGKSACGFWVSMYRLGTQVLEQGIKSEFLLYAEIVLPHGCSEFRIPWR